MMLLSWVSGLLTFSQVIYLAGALPRPQNLGECLVAWRHKRNLQDCCSKSEIMLTDAATAQTTTLGLTYTSAITFLDVDLDVQVVTSTDIPSTQTPTTTTLVTQNTPDSSGVSNKNTVFEQQED